MNICIFTRHNDHRLNYLIQTVEKQSISITLIVTATKRKGTNSLRSLIKRILLPGKRNNKLPPGLGYRIRQTDHHSSNSVKSLLLENKIDTIFLSKSGIIRPNIIEGPWRIINCHPGILPRYRGVGSCEWAVYESGPLGVTAHYVDHGIDTGPIIHREYVEPHAGETLYDFRKRLDWIGADIFSKLACRLSRKERLPEKLQDIDSGILYTRKPNVNEIPYIEKRLKERQLRSTE
jgi:methionyl-tRNA formyltransferase|tara:strand:- start:7358 stop:8059 length:702 start_codon:yes stop_codon:yes gene_type:complete